MEIRNIQRTGDMHYLYLPTAWCREHNIGSKSKISIEHSSDGSLIISPQIVERKQKHLKFDIKEDNPEVIHKLVLASYINPVSSFEINMEKGMDFTKLLNQKRLISLESVAIDKNQISCGSTVTISDPLSLLKTMLKKIKNMTIVMCKNYEKDLIEKYEDEIDRSKMLIDKAVIGSLTVGKTTKLKNIELYYISLISKELERMVDRLIRLDGSYKKFLEEITKPIDMLQNILENTSKMDQDLTLKFVSVVSLIKKSDPKDVNSINMARMRQNLIKISEVVMDWMVTLRLED